MVKGQWKKVKNGKGDSGRKLKRGKGQWKKATMGKEGQCKKAKMLNIIVEKREKSKGIMEEGKKW